MPEQTFLFLVFVGICVCSGLYAVSIVDSNPIYRLSQKMRQLVRRGLVSKYIFHPILLCETCMTSIWGTLTYALLLFGRTSMEEALRMYVPFLLAVALGNYALWTVLSTFRAIRDHYANLNRAAEQHPQPDHRSGRD